MVFEEWYNETFPDEDSRKNSIFSYNKINHFLLENQDVEFPGSDIDFFLKLICECKAVLINSVSFFLSNEKRILSTIQKICEGDIHYSFEEENPIITALITFYCYNEWRGKRENEVFFFKKFSNELIQRKALFIVGWSDFL